jgi:apurinic endonuclease APN1
MSLNNLQIGWHTTISPSVIKGLSHIIQTHHDGKSTYKYAAQIFLKSPMCAGSCKLTAIDCQNVKEFLQQNNMYIVIHGQYIINFIKTDIEWAIQSVIQDLKMVDQMVSNPSSTTLHGDGPSTGVIIHMGKNTEHYSVETCIDNFYKNIKQVLETPFQSKLILETSTKTKNGNDVFYDIKVFGQLVRYLKEKLTSEQYDRIGYCIDTCHVFASGYDIRTREGFTDFIELWNSEIGRLTVFHLNDSKVGLCCCRDLHQQIGKGFIYSDHKDGLQALLEYAKENNIPVILETAGDQKEELNLIQTLI